MAQKKGHSMVPEMEQTMETSRALERECLKECQMEHWMGTRMAEAMENHLAMQKVVWWEYQLILLDLELAAS